MFKTKRYLIVIISLFQIAACGRYKSEPAAKMHPEVSRFEQMQVTAETVEGEWESACNVESAENGYYLKTFLSLHQGRVTKKLSLYQDADCKLNPIWDRTMAGQSTFLESEFRQEYFTMTILSQNAVQTQLLNRGPPTEDRYCRSVVAFEMNKALSFSPVSQCNEAMAKTSIFDLRGDGGRAHELIFDHLRFNRSSANH